MEGHDDAFGAESREGLRIPQATVLIFVNGDKVLLAKKKRKLGKGKWNGYGGFREPSDATLEETVIRELLEEIGTAVQISPVALEKAGVMTYVNEKESGRFNTLEVHFYIARYDAQEWNGMPQETEEMGAPQWFDVDGMPYDEMLPSDEQVFKLLLGGKKIRGQARRDKNWNLVPGSLQIDECEHLE